MKITITSPKQAPGRFSLPSWRTAVKSAGTAVLAIGVALAGMLAGTPASAAADQQAVKFVEDLGANAINIISNKSAGRTEMEQEFDKLLQENADIRRIAAFALGRYIRTPDNEQKTEYLKLFEDFIVKVYVTRLSD